MNHKYIDQMALSPAVSLDLKANGDGAITGYASTFGGEPDRQGDIVLPGAFTKSLARHGATGDRPVMLWAHQQEQPIGRWTRISEDAKGLYVEGRLNLGTDKGRNAYEHIKGGDVGGLSIGFVTAENGRKYAGSGAFHLSEVDIYEISIVSIPANPAARVTTVKSLDSKADAIDLLRNAGLSRKAASRFAAGGWSALQNDSPDPEKTMQLAAQVDAAIKLMRQ